MSETVPGTPPRRKPLENPNVRRGLTIGGAVILIVLAVAGLRWWTHGRFVQSTNDAYLRADQVTVAPKVQGYVSQVFVTDNQTVAAGQPLLKIDAASYDAVSAQRQAAVDARRADIAAAERQVDQQRAALEQVRAQLASAETSSAFAGQEAGRYASLSAQGAETAERFAQAKNQKDEAAAKVRADTAAVHQTERQIEAAEAQVVQAKAQLEAAGAEVNAAKLNLDDTLIRASIAGRIGDKSVRVGQFVQPGTRLMSVVPVSDIYVVANFKETQIARMKIGQVATVAVDALDGAKVDAVIDSFSPGTGAQFALLPPENATGNFTKIVQRVPVRLKLRPAKEMSSRDMMDRFLPGLSVTVEVDTQQSPVADEPASHN